MLEIPDKSFPYFSRWEVIGQAAVHIWETGVTYMRCNTVHFLIIIFFSNISFYTKCTGPVFPSLKAIAGPCDSLGKVFSNAPLGTGTVQISPRKGTHLLAHVRRKDPGLQRVAKSIFFNPDFWGIQIWRKKTA